ncbi:GntR family transcriptional regulator [Dysosmobacter sp.]
MKAIDNQLIKDRVVAELRRAILYGEYVQGEALYQDKIAEELGVSRMPVREALQILHNEGLVTVNPNKVAYVNEVSSKFLADHFRVRTMLEAEAIRLCCEKCDHCAALWKHYHDAEKAIREENIPSFNEANQAIHALIWKYADNVVLERILSQLWNNSILDYGAPADQASLSNADHKEMIEAIEQHDVKSAQQLAVRHVDRSYQRILAKIK